MNNIVLVGFMAVGKSAVGKYLKSNLCLSLFDVDGIIEKEEGMKIKDIFKKQGEEYFRLKEKEIAKRLLARNNNIISTGGGLFMDEEIRKLALKNNFVIFLDLDINEVYRRVQRNDIRPLAKARSKKELEDLYNLRLPYYNEATVKVDVNGKTSKKVADEITKLYFKWLNKEL
ncbi:MAG: shikimate kinase [Lachnospirales bacterium]